MWMLIVDDEAFAREAVIESVDWGQYGLEVRGVSSAAEALAFMCVHEVDILMTDIKMPQKDGLELIEEVHGKGLWPGIIVLSSFNEFDLVRNAMRLGAEDYLFKPSMMPRDILDAVLKVKDRRSRKHEYASGRGVQEVQKREMQKAVEYIRQADVLIVGGTSLVVYPAAGLIDYYEGSKLVLINKSETGRDSQADLVIREPIGQVFDEILER